MVRFLALMILSFAGFFSVKAQDCALVLTGVVQDVDGNDLPGATLLLSGKAITASDAGEFAFPELCAGDFELIIRYTGYIESHVPLRISQNKRIVVKLSPSETTLSAVEVSGSSTRTGLTNSTYSLSQQELEHFSGKSLGEALKRVPGVSALQTGPAIFKPVIDGLHSTRKD